MLPSLHPTCSIALNHTARLLVMRQKLSGEPADDLLAALEQAATQVVDSMLEKHADEEEGQT